MIPKIIHYCWFGGGKAIVNSIIYKIVEKNNARL